MPVRNRLKELRHDNRMNQTEFSDFLGVSRHVYNRWERQTAQPSVEWVLRISARLEVPVERIVYLEDNASE